jgi:hypothetical protein
MGDPGWLMLMENGFKRASSDPEWNNGEKKLEKA